MTTTHVVFVKPPLHFGLLYSAICFCALNGSHSPYMDLQLICFYLHNTKSFFINKLSAGPLYRVASLLGRLPTPLFLFPFPACLLCTGATLLWDMRATQPGWRAGDRRKRDWLWAGQPLTITSRATQTSKLQSSYSYGSHPEAALYSLTPQTGSPRLSNVTAATHIRPCSPHLEVKP